jgi:O-succinylbenzoate synthase
MKLQSVEVRRARLPLVRPFRTSFGTEYEKDVLLLQVSTDDGTVGWGEAVCERAPLYNHEFNDAAILVLRDHLVPRLAAAGELTAADVPGLLRPVRGNPGARGALEMAVLDAELRAAGVSLAAHLGAVRDRVDCGVSVGIPADDRLATLLAEVEGYVEAGYQRIKLKIQPGWDIEPTTRVRERWPEVPLQVDANQAYGRDDIEHLARLDELDLLLIEQPLHEDDLLGHRLLAQRMRTPVCLDESVISVATAESAIDYGACEVVNIKAGRVGGYLQAQAIHDLCRSRGVAVWCGGMVETGLGRAANLALAALPGFTLVGDTSASDRFFARDVTEPFVMVEGQIAVPGGPGLGVQPIPEVLDAVTVWRASLLE